MNDTITLKDLIKIDDYTYELPQSHRPDMLVPVRIFMNDRMIEDVLRDKAVWQLANVATLPGIQNYAYGMPDIHQGYGFPIGGVAGSAIDEGGVISPGGIGYDINCGVRLLAGQMSAKDLKPYLDTLATELFHAIPSGVGRGGNLTFKPQELDKILTHGAHRMLELDYGIETDIIFCEEQGRMDIAQSSLISQHAKQRGADQIGTLGSGNHFLEIQMVDEIFDEKAAETFGLYKGQVTMMIHCGSRGLGHQTCTDYVRTMVQKLPEWGYELPDRELVYAPFNSSEARNYFSAMAAASNYAWANRHMISHWVRQTWHKIVGKEIDLNLVYDVSHNIGKIETHSVNGIDKQLIMHRKGATRAFGPGHPEIPQAYQAVGQPVLIPGTMGTASYVLTGSNTNSALGSSCHGAGRKMSRTKAKKEITAHQLRQQLEHRGIIVRSDSDEGLVEEAPGAYKDIEDVIDVVHGAGLARKVARLKPLAVIKGG